MPKISHIEYYAYPTGVQHMVNIWGNDERPAILLLQFDSSQQLRLYIPGVYMMAACLF